MLKKLLPDKFIIALLTSVLLATVLPAEGIAATWVGWLANGAIVLLFFFVGAKLARSAIVEGLIHWRLHLVILLSTFVMFPLMALGLSRTVPTLFDDAIWLGILFLAALPSTVQSSIALTTIARGNVAAAIAAASMSQLLGIFLTPAILALIAGVHDAEISFSGFGKIIVQIFVPFLLGHLCRPLIAGWLARHKSLVAMTDRATILIAVYSAFSAAVIEGLWSRVPASLLISLVVACLVMLVIALGFTFFVARSLKFNREDRIAILFCGTKKSLVQGVPMAKVLFAGPSLGLVLLPIMIFHQAQLMVCASIARRYAEDEIDE